MSIKAGRVGVNPSQVDPVDGSILSSITSGYTKQEADAKFLTQTDAASTYESKSDASTAHNALQPKTLAVPIEMLSGTKLTVESALQGLNSDKQDKISTDSVLGSLVEGATVDSIPMGNHIYKRGSTVMFCLTLNSVTVGANENIGVIPEGYRPAQNILVDIGDRAYRFLSDGGFQCTSALTAQRINIYAVYAV